MRLYNTLFELCDINLFITRSCSVNADCSVPLAGCCGYYSVALCENTADKSWCCKSKGVCVTTALTGQLQGSLPALFVSFPFFVFPTLPLQPLVPNQTLLWEQNLQQENELGPIGLGRRISLGIHGLCQEEQGAASSALGPVLPRAAARCLGACSTLWEGVMSGKGDWPLSFFPLSLFEENLPLVTLLTGDQLNCKFNGRASVKVLSDCRSLNLCLFQVFVMMQTLLQKPIPAVWCYKVHIGN